MPFDARKLDESSYLQTVGSAPEHCKGGAVT
jgi:hypothetical protein